MDSRKTAKLKDLSEFKNGYNADKDQYGYGTKFINVSEIFENDSLLSTDIPGEVQIERESNETIRGKVRMFYSIELETFEDIARSAVYLDEEQVIFGGFVIRGRPKTDKLLPEFANTFSNRTTYGKNW